MKLTRRLGAVLTAGLVLSATLGGVAGAAGGTRRLQPAERRFRALTNHERVEHGRDGLRVNRRLVRLARRHSREMARTEDLHHRADLTAGLGSMSWSVVGENVGVGPTVPSLHEAFMESPPHRRNVLDRDYERLGVGVVRRDGTRWVTLIFLG